MAIPTPGTLPMAEALGRSEPLNGLLRRIADARGRMATIAPQLPAALRDGVRAGPLDDAGWVLLVSDSAAAAKLRQLMPALESALQAAGWPPLALRIKVLPKS